MAADDLLRDLINQHFFKEDRFTLDKAYEIFEDPFQEEYPNNSHIRAKIRQQLQVLRD